MGYFAHGQRHQLVAGVAQDVTQRLVHRQPLAVRSHQGHGDGGVFEGLLEPRLGQLGPGCRLHGVRIQPASALAFQHQAIGVGEHSPPVVAGGKHGGGGAEPVHQGRAPFRCGPEPQWRQERVGGHQRGDRDIDQAGEFGEGQRGDDDAWCEIQVRVVAGAPACQALQHDGEGCQHQRHQALLPWGPALRLERNGSFAALKQGHGGVHRGPSQKRVPA